MHSLPFFLRRRVLTLLAGLCCLVSFSHAGELDANLNATIVDTTCKFSVENGDDVYLPTVMRSWFYNADGSNRYTPTDRSGRHAVYTPR